MKKVISLVERVRKGDRDAFNELYKLHYLPVRFYAELMLNADDAEDVVQDVFLNIWLHREGLDESLSLRSYLLRSVYNSSLNLLKRKSNSNNYHSVCEKEIEEMGYNQYDPDSSDIIRRLYDQDLRVELNAAIESLPVRCREIFTLSYIDELPSKEISEQLGISLSTVNNHIYSALKQLREKLGEHRSGLLMLSFLLCSGKNVF